MTQMRPCCLVYDQDEALRTKSIVLSTIGCCNYYVISHCRCTRQCNLKGVRMEKSKILALGREDQRNIIGVISLSPDSYIFSYMLSPSVLSRLFGNPWTVAHQAPLFMEFSRQEYWSGLPVSTLSSYR